MVLPAEETMSPCEHTRFHAHVHVNRRVDTETGKMSYLLTFGAMCADCGRAFVLRPQEANVSLDGTTLSVPAELGGPVSRPGGPTVPSRTDLLRQPTLPGR
jgi:hypothetical protein